MAGRSAPDGDLQRVRQLLGEPALEPLIRKLERRLAKQPLVEGHVSLNAPSAATREAVTSLLGALPGRGKSLRIPLASLDRVVRESGAAPGLIEALTILLGRRPQHPAVERRKQRATWQRLHEKILNRDKLDPVIADWLRQICQSGVLQRAARGDERQATELLNSLASCAAALPLDEPTPLPVFAAARLGDSHALDADRPLYRLLLRAAAILCGRPIPPGTEHARKVCAGVNIVLDELSSTVLLLNLPAVGDGLVDRTLREHAARGMPCRLTFRQLRLERPTFSSAAETIFVCENPSVLAAAADRHGAACRPLICTEGQPSHAALALLHTLRGYAKLLAYHGDFDAAGLRIAGQMTARLAAQPWRMGSQDYLADVGRSRLQLDGDIPPTPWDPELQDAVLQHRRILLEETVLEHLLNDLKRRI